MPIYIDRRENPKGKSLNNRQKFIRRISSDVKKSINDAIKDRNIADVGEGENIKIPSKGISEPSFRADRKTGDKWIINPGNEEYVEGDRIKKPTGGKGGAGPDASKDPQTAEDEFIFQLSKDEFLDFFFEDLELPDLIKTKLKEIQNMKYKHSGITTVGNPATLNIKRTMQQSLGRRIALKRPKKETLELLVAQIDFHKEEVKSLDGPEEQKMLLYIVNLEKQLQVLIGKSKRVPYLDPLDLRYNLFLPQPQPNTQAAMFCVMDVSGSMGEREKDLAKRFFILLYMFLKRRYSKVELIFLRHHTSAAEVDEQEFFYGQETGGTIVSTSLQLMKEIIQARYPRDEWNIYCAQASDGDNYSGDSETCVKILEDKLMDWLQYFAYVQIERDSEMLRFGGVNELWKHYEQFTETHPNFAMKKIKNRKDIFPVFKELFSKETTNA